MKACPLGEAHAGNTVFISRKHKLIAIFGEDGPERVLDAYVSHPLGKENPTRGDLGPDESKDLDWDREFVPMVEIPPDKDWSYHFYRLDFDPGEPLMVPEETLDQVDNGQYYVLDLSEAGALAFRLPEVKNPKMTVLFSLRDSPVPSLVVTIGPGPE